MINYEEIGMRIRQARTMRKKVSQPIMAEALGMYQADISNLERAQKGSGITDLAKLDAIADYLDLPLQYLLFGTFPDSEQGKDDNTMKSEDTIKKYKRLLSYETIYGNPVDLIEDDGDDYFRWLMEQMQDSMNQLNAQIDRDDYERWIPEYLDDEYKKLKSKTTLIVIRFLGYDGNEYKETLAQGQVREYLDWIESEKSLKFVSLGEATEEEHKGFIAAGNYDEDYWNYCAEDTIMMAVGPDYESSGEGTANEASATPAFMNIPDDLDEELPFD